jgi:repressor LexA
VVIRQLENAQNGEIVAAMIDGDATVKTLKRSDGHVWLMPHNPAYTPILGDDAKILGKVVAVIRRVLFSLCRPLAGGAHSKSARAGI